MTSPLLTVDEAAAYLRLGTTTVRRLAQTGRISVIRIGSRTFFTEPDLDEFIEQSRVTAEAPPARPASSFRRGGQVRRTTATPNFDAIRRHRPAV